MQESGETNNAKSEKYKDLILYDEEYDSHNESSWRKYDAHHDDDGDTLILIKDIYFHLS